jgi:parallel beta-helix repeat protein
LEFSANCTVILNTFESNGVAVDITSSYGCEVYNNTCSLMFYGVFLLESDLCTIAWNSFNDIHYGVYIFASSSNNLIFHNAFTGSGSESRAYDDGTNNMWYNSNINEGNYWDNWSGSGSYLIAGATGAYDNYPLASPSTIIPEYNQFNWMVIVLIALPLIGGKRKRE